MPAVLKIRFRIERIVGQRDKFLIRFYWRCVLFRLCEECLADNAVNRLSWKRKYDCLVPTEIRRPQPPKDVSKIFDVPSPN